MKAAKFAVLGIVLSTPLLAHAIACDVLQAEIDAKFKAGGVPSVVLAVVPAGDVATDQAIVGSCENGSRKIVRAPATAGLPAGANSTSTATSGAGALGGVSASQAAAPSMRKDRSAPLTTECKEGFTGTDCQHRVPSDRR